MQKKRCIGLILFLGVVFVNFNLLGMGVLAKPTEQSIKIVIDYCDENTSEPNVLYWGSEVGLSAKSSCNTGIKWNLSNDGSKDIEVSTVEYRNSKGDSCIRVYAPFGYSDELTITAISKDNEKNLGTYTLKIEDGTEWNGTTFFEFDMNVPEGKKLNGEIPKIEEQWDADTQEYSIVLPSITCSVDEYTFEGWKDKKGNLYQPQETLSVKYGDTVYYTIYAKWKKNNDSTEEVGSVNKNDSVLFTSAFLCILIGIAVILLIIILICMYQKRKKRLD